jgi:hypothetical protein
MTAPRQPLDPVEEHELLQQITSELLGTLPPGWRQFVMDFKAIGRHIDGSANVRTSDGVLRWFHPPATVGRLLQDLRRGMYRDGVGTWSSARYSIAPQSQFSIDFNYEDEPDWSSPPPPESYAEELRRFPRTEDNIPSWFVQTTEAPPPDAEQWEPVLLGPDEQEALVRGVSGQLLDVAPESWQELRFTSYNTVSVDSCDFIGVTSDGQPHKLQYPSGVPSAAMQQMAKLREGMYQEGKGAWFTANLVIKRRPGSYSIEYDYDNQPDFFPPLTAHQYALDLDYFPRTPENTPDWLKRKIEGAAGDEP